MTHFNAIFYVGWLCRNFIFCAITYLVSEYLFIAEWFHFRLTLPAFDTHYQPLTRIRYVVLCESVIHLTFGAASQSRYDEMPRLPSCIHRPLI